MQAQLIATPNFAGPGHDPRLHGIRTLVVLWLLVFAFGLTLVLLVLIAGWVRADRTRLQHEVETLQLLISDASLPSAETLQLQAELSHTTALIASVQAVVVPVSVEWPGVVDALNQFDLAGVTLTGLQQTGDKIQLTGRAGANDDVVRYQQSLLDSGVFREVIVASLTQSLPPDPAAAPPDASPEAAAPPLPVAGAVDFVFDLVVPAPGQNSTQDSTQGSTQEGVAP
jgi:Tfp pilus assembly protein PilN